MLRVLLTNDDGIEAEGLQTLRRALVALDDIVLAVIAPDAQLSATARLITTRRPLWVHEVPFEDGTIGYSSDGTPVDCVRLAQLGLVERLRPRPRGGRASTTAPTSATTSPTRARSPPRSRALVLGIPGIAVSQQSQRARDGLPARPRLRLRDRGRRSPRGSSTGSTTCRCPTGTLLNINVPAGEADGVEVTRLGKRIYRDELKQVDSDDEGRRRYWIYGDDPVHDDEPGTDLAAVHAGRIAVTPAALRPHRRAGLDALPDYDLARLLAPAAGEVQ